MSEPIVVVYKDSLRIPGKLTVEFPEDAERVELLSLQERRDNIRNEEYTLATIKIVTGKVYDVLPPYINPLLKGGIRYED